MLELVKIFLVISVTQIQICFCAGDEDAKCLGEGWENATKLNGYCYIARDENRHNYYDAQDYCVSIGGNLASIHSDKENGLVLDLCVGLNYPSCWIGIHKRYNGSWVWSDLTTVDYENWAMEDGIDEQCTFIDYYSRKWYRTLRYNCNHTDFSYICKKPVDIVTTSSIATSTATSSIATSTAATSNTSQYQSGCISYFREECPKPNISSQIDESHQDDPVQCQRLCQLHDQCKSFTFDYETDKCYLYSTPVTEMKDCVDVGGPDDPGFDECKEQGCQDFFQSSCDEEELKTLTVSGGFSDLASCETFCQENYKCKDWEVVNKTTCKLFFNQPHCRTVTGPRDTPIQRCF